MRELLYKCKLIFRVNWVQTVYINFKLFDILTAIKFPIFMYNNCRYNGSGEIKLQKNNVHPGIIKLGVNIEPSCISKVGVVIINNGQIIIEGSGIIGNGSSVIVNKDATIILGRNFSMTGDIKIHCFKKICVGKNFSCSWDVSISDTDIHEYINYDTNELLDNSKEIIVGDNVWCCQKSMICKGSIIPSWTTIAAFSLVNKKYSISEYSVIGGIPARYLGKKIKRQDMEYIEKLSDLFFITKGFRTFTLWK